MHVECRSCLRRETWSDGDRRIDQPGGSRRPTEHALLAAWHTLRAAELGGRTVVAACPCGQPMIADRGGTAIPWVLETLGGPIHIQDEIVGPTGVMNAESTEAMLTELYGPRFEFRPMLAVFQGTVMLSIVAPFLLWIAALATVILMLSALMQPVGF